MKDRFGHECGDPAPSLQELYDERDALLARIGAGDERAREMLPLVRAAIASREDECEMRALGA